MHPYLQNLIQSIDLEEKEQAQRFRLDEQHSLKSLKAEGLALHPITIARKTFGYADYPEISFRLPFPTETNLFKDGAAIECFCAGEEPSKRRTDKPGWQSWRVQAICPRFSRLDRGQRRWH